MLLKPAMESTHGSSSPEVRLRIGLFGGSFNPVHNAHLLAAQAAREELGLTRLVFIPAAQSPFKPAQPLAPAEQRLRLLRLALAGETGCEVDDWELREGGVSYSVDTLRHYAGRFPGAALYYLVGGDHVALLPEWREASELARLAEFVVVPRPGAAPQPLPPPFRGRHLRGFPLALSASEVRERVRAGQAIHRLVPPAVAEAIRNNRLYLD